MKQEIKVGSGFDKAMDRPIQRSETGFRPEPKKWFIVELTKKQLDYFLETAKFLKRGIKSNASAALPFSVLRKKESQTSNQGLSELYI